MWISTCRISVCMNEEGSHSHSRFQRHGVSVCFHCFNTGRRGQQPGENFGQEGEGPPLIIIAAMVIKHVLRTYPSCSQSNNQEFEWAQKKYSKVSY